NENVPSIAAHRRPLGTGPGSPEDVGVATRVTVFSARLRAKKHQPSATSAAFHASAGNRNMAYSITAPTSTLPISAHRRALAFSNDSRPRGHVSVIQSAAPSEISERGPSTSRKYVPQITARPQR